MGLVLDFGLPVSGAPGLTATGTTQATAYVLAKHINVFTTVPQGSGVVLPSSYASGSQIWVLNRGEYPLAVYPALGDQIEQTGINEPMVIEPGSNIQFTSFDPPITASPRTWWLNGYAPSPADWNAQVAVIPAAVATIAALRAAQPSTLIQSQCYVLGYYAASDGGEGVFVYNASDTTSADNGGTIIVDAAGRRWYRQVHGDLALEACGVQNDPTGTNIAANTFAWLAAVEMASGKYNLVHREALSIVLESVMISSPLNLRLDGTWKLGPQQNNNVAYLDSDNITISGSGTIDGNKANQTGGVGTMVGGICSGMGGTNSTRPLPPTNPIVINNIFIAGITITNCFNWPISLGYVNKCSVQNTSLTYSQSSPQFIFSATDSWFINNLVHDITDGGFVFYQGCNNCGAYGNTVYNSNDGIGVYADDGTYATDNQILIADNIIYNIQDTGIGITTGGASPENQTNILVENNILTACNARGSNGRGSIGLVGCQGVTVRGNWIAGDGANSMAGNITYSIYAGNTCNNIVIDSNTISNVGSTSANGTAIYLNSPVGCAVTNNRIYDTGETAATGSGIGGAAGTRNIFGGNVLLTPIAGFLMEVNLASDSILIGQMNAAGQTRFSSGVEIVDPNNINANNPVIISGAGAPSIVEPAASLYLQRNGGPSNRLWISGGGGFASVMEMVTIGTATSNTVTNKVQINTGAGTLYLLASSEPG